MSVTRFAKIRLRLKLFQFKPRRKQHYNQSAILTAVTEERCLLRCGTVESGRSSPTFRKNVLLLLLGPKVKPSKKPLPTQKMMTWCEEKNHNFKLNLKIGHLYYMGVRGSEVA